MRVISGSARGHKLLTLEGGETRPTSGSVKEAMMSIVQFELDGAKILDLFAGTGQLGIEALSRGAHHCVFVDQNRRCQFLIADNLRHTKLEDRGTIIGADSRQWLKTANSSFDIVFVDPPYYEDLLLGILPEVVSLVAKSGAILCESDKREELPEEIGNFFRKKEYLYGKRKITLYRCREIE